MKETLVILPYCDKNKQGSELELSLRGWSTFCRFPYRLIVVGGKANDCENIVIPQVPDVQGQYHQHLDVMNNFIEIYNRFHNEYDGFIWTADDNFPISPFCLEDITTVHYLSAEMRGDIDTPTWYWKHDQAKTKVELEVQNLPTVNYTTHYPAYIQFDRLKEICDRYDLLRNSYVFENLYFNSYEHESVQVRSIRYPFWKPATDEELAECFSGKYRFCCCSEEGWSDKMEHAIEKNMEPKQ